MKWNIFSLYFQQDQNNKIGYRQVEWAPFLFGAGPILHDSLDDKKHDKKLNKFQKEGWQKRDKKKLNEIQKSHKMDKTGAK